MGKLFTLLQSALDDAGVVEAQVKSFEVFYLPEGIPVIRFQLFCGKKVVWAETSPLRWQSKEMRLHWSNVDERNALIVELRGLRMTQTEISTLVGISQSLVSSVLRRVGQEHTPQKESQ